MYTFESDVIEPSIKRFKRASEGYADLDTDTETEFDSDSELEFEFDLKG